MSNGELKLPTSWRSKLVVIVDDETNARMLLCRLLGNCGCACVCFAGGDDVLRNLQNFIDLGGDPNNYADAVITDFDMGGGLQGDAVVTALRRRGFCGPVLVITGNHGDAADLCIAAGASAVMYKPISPASLQAKLAALPPSLSTSDPRTLPRINPATTSQAEFPVHGGAARRDAVAATWAALYRALDALDSAAAAAATAEPTVRTPLHSELHAVRDRLADLAAAVTAEMTALRDEAAAATDGSGAL